MDTLRDRPSVLVVAAEDVDSVQQNMQRGYDDPEDELEEQEYSGLATYIKSVFEENKNVRQTSGIEEKLFQSLRSYNGNYDPEDLAKIRESGGGSEIYMNLTPTKCRAAISWIRDIMMPAKETAWGFEPTAVPDLPEDIVLQIETYFDDLAKTQAVPQAPQPGQPQQTPAPQAAAQKLQAISQLKRDVEDAITDEIFKIAQGEVKKFERVVADQLQEGSWDKALSEFIEDFCVFQVAILKGPIVTKKKRISYVNGEVKETSDFIFLNKRISPFDIYPSASATDITDGDLCEHVRFDKKTLYNMIGTKHYKDEMIRKVLKDCEGGSSSISTQIDSDRAIEEFRGDTFRANKGLVHGIHFFGSVPFKELQEWGFPEEQIGTDEYKMFEVEAILAGNEVIKCVLNDDPLLRRPYYKASFQNIPGSWWGRSLPEMMRDIQRMCNATARALANNMGIASGPQIEVYTDRMADDSEIEAMKPFHVWQLTSDPSGAGGRAIQFWQPSSNASELLAVYKEFEIRADDATGIPRYAYGNERTGGAAQTASGLSMLLESAAKGIKDSVRNIDYGLVKPRVERQFYLNVISSDSVKFTGDVNVVPRGSEILTMKGASEMRRNEFVQLLANPAYLEIVGMEGIADILREMAKSLGLGHNIVPSRLELKQKQEESKAMQQQQMQMQQEEAQGKQQTSLQATQMQVQGQDAMNQRSLQLKAEEIKANIDQQEKDRQIKVIELQQAREDSVSKQTSSLQTTQMIEANKALNVDKQIALSLKTGDRVNQQ